MSEPMKGMSCTLGCWIMAGAIGALAFVLMLVVGEVSVIGDDIPVRRRDRRSWPHFLISVLPRIAGTGKHHVRTAPRGRSQHRRRATATAGSCACADSNGQELAFPMQSRMSGRPLPIRMPKSGASVKPSKALSGEEDLKSRKGNWKYEGDTAASAAVEGEGTKPAMLEAARAEGADDLKKIKGIGPKLEELCNSMGFYHFDQIAAWTSAEVAWVDQNLEGFKGRVTRDEWVPQAKIPGGGQRDRILEARRQGRRVLNGQG